jgi:hypothetical protein
VPHQCADPGRFERLFNGVPPRYANIGEQTIVKFEKLPVLVPSLTSERNPGQP